MNELQDVSTTGNLTALRAQPWNGSRRRRVALLGAGYIASWHAKCLPSVSGVDLVAVCDRVGERARQLAAAFGIPRHYASLEELLAGEQLDAVHILLPPDAHFEAARAAIEAGVHVYIEKPMCESAERCDELLSLAARRGIRLGVGHNFLFSEPYARLRRDAHSGLLGRIDQVTITWNRELAQARFGPFDLWMLRDPRHIVLEAGSHAVAQMLDLAGVPDTLAGNASDPRELLSGVDFYRRWRVHAQCGPAAVELRFSFLPGFTEYTVHARGSLGAASADLEHNTYTLDRNHAADPDFENYAIVTGRARLLRRQGRQTLARYILSKLHVEKRGTPYGESIARAMDAFYAAGPLDPRVSAARAAAVIRACATIGELANPRSPRSAPCNLPRRALAPPPRILVLGGTGFIGKELVRQLSQEGRALRLLVRSTANLPQCVLAQAECHTGDILNRDDLLRAMEGMECVVHLARSNVKTWADYRRYEVEATRQIAECALEAGVKRFVYAGTIDSYYAGARGGVITESTPLDPHIARRNLYARAKAASEEMLQRLRRERGLPLVIVRPGVVIGRGGSPFHWGVGMWWHEAVCQTWGPGVTPLPLVLVEDVARGLIAAMDKHGIEGSSFNLVADPCLSAQEYLDALDSAGAMRVQRHATPILRFYLMDMLKWMVKVAVRHPERRAPAYRDWASRSARARFDCSAAKSVLNWTPVSDRATLIRRGIEEPLREYLA